MSTSHECAHGPSFAHNSFIFTGISGGRCENRKCVFFIWLFCFSPSPQKIILVLKGKSVNGWIRSDDVKDQFWPFVNHMNNLACKLLGGGGETLTTSFTKVDLIIDQTVKEVKGDGGNK